MQCLWKKTSPPPPKPIHIKRLFFLINLFLGIIWDAYNRTHYMYIRYICHNLSRDNTATEYFCSVPPLRLVIFSAICVSMCLVSCARALLWSPAWVCLSSFVTQHTREHCRLRTYITDNDGLCCWPYQLVFCSKCMAICWVVAEGTNS